MRRTVLKVISVLGSRASATSWPAPGLRRLETSLPLDEPIPGTLPGPVPGAVECAWFEDVPSLLAAQRAASLAELIAAGPALRFVAREHVILPVPDVAPSPDGVRMISFFRRASGMDVAAFEAYWRLRHGPIVGRTPRLRRYVQNHLVEAHREAARAPFCDGITEIWFDSLEDFRSGWSSAAVQEEQVRDCLNFISEGVMHAVLGPPELRTRARAAAGA